MIITVTGWTWETVDSLTLPQATELTDYWADFPPLHLMVKNYMGIESKGKAKPKTQQSNEAELRALAQQFNAGG